MTDATNTLAARAIADLSEGTILATVDIAVPAERVFQALTTDEVTHWWGSPQTYRTTEWHVEVRVGGRWRAAGRGADGVPFAVEGEYLEVDPPRTLVQTWKADWDGKALTTLRYRLEPIAGGTRVTLRHDGFRGRPESCRGHCEGWEMVLGWLQRHLTADAKKPGGGKFFLCRLVGPRPSFPADITEKEGQVMQQHIAYWTELLKKGTAVVFGPVLDPRGVWGLGVVEVASEAEVQELTTNDPTVRSGLGFKLDAYPMMDAVRSR